MKSHLFVHICVALTALAAVSSRAHAQGPFTINENNAGYTLTELSTSTGNGPTSNFTIQSVDHLVRNFWWIGTGLNRTREFALDAASVTSAGHINARSYQQTFDVGNVTIRIDYSIDSVSTSGAIVTQTLTATNNAITPVTLDLFNIVDTNISATSTFDRASGPDHPDTITIRDAITNVEAKMYIPAAFGYQAGAASTMLGLMTDTDFDILNNSGMPFAGVDCTVGVQWRFDSIPRGRSRSCTVLFAVGVAQPLVSAGACVLTGGACTFTTEHDCNVRAGTFLGNGTRCLNTSCPCDWNGRDFINSQDFFDFLTDFFLGIADYNQDGLMNSQDYFDFLLCFLNPPGSCFP